MDGGSILMVAIGVLAIQLVMILCIVKLYQYTDQINQKMTSIKSLMEEIAENTKKK